MPSSRRPKQTTKIRWGANNQSFAALKRIAIILGRTDKRRANSQRSKSIKTISKKSPVPRAFPIIKKPSVTAKPMSINSPQAGFMRVPGTKRPRRRVPFAIPIVSVKELSKPLPPLPKVVEKHEPFVPEPTRPRWERPTKTDSSEKTGEHFHAHHSGVVNPDVLKSGIERHARPQAELALTLQEIANEAREYHKGSNSPPIPTHKKEIRRAERMMDKKKRFILRISNRVSTQQNLRNSPLTEALSPWKVPQSPDPTQGYWTQQAILGLQYSLSKRTEKYLNEKQRLHLVGGVDAAFAKKVKQQLGELAIDLHQLSREILLLKSTASAIALNRHIP